MQNRWSQVEDAQAEAQRLLCINTKTPRQINSPRGLHIVSITYRLCFFDSTVGHPPPCAQTSRLITLRIYALPPPVPFVHQYEWIRARRFIIVCDVARRYNARRRLPYILALSCFQGLCIRRTGLGGHVF